MTKRIHACGAWTALFSTPARPPTTGWRSASRAIFGARRATPAAGGPATAVSTTPRAAARGRQVGGQRAADGDLAGARRPHDRCAGAQQLGGEPEGGGAVAGERVGGGAGRRDRHRRRREGDRPGRDGPLAPAAAQAHEQRVRPRRDVVEARDRGVGVLAEHRLHPVLARLGQRDDPGAGGQRPAARRVRRVRVERGQLRGRGQPADAQAGGAQPADERGGVGTVDVGAQQVGVDGAVRDLVARRLPRARGECWAATLRGCPGRAPAARSRSSAAAGRRRGARWPAGASRPPACGRRPAPRTVRRHPARRSSRRRRTASSSRRRRSP